MDFKKQCPTKKDAAGKSVKAYYVDAVMIKGFEQQKKGGTTFRVPKFHLAPLSEDTNKQALGLDAELQAFLSDYLKRPRVEAAASAAKDDQPNKNGHFDDMKDDLPWQEEEARRERERDEEVPF
jgi:hypothetical protein